MVVFRSSKAFCWSVVHSNLAPSRVRRLSGSQRLEKLLMYLDRYATICRKDISSSLVLGGWHCWAALVLSGLGLRPSAVKRCPWKLRVGVQNSHFSLRIVKLLASILFRRMWRFLLWSAQSVPPIMMSSRLLRTRLMCTLAPCRSTVGR